MDQDLIDKMGEDRLRQLGAAMKVAAYHGAGRHVESESAIDKEGHMNQKDSGNKVYHILAFVFQGEARAQEVARQVKVDRKATADEVVIAKAVVAVDARGKSHVHEAGHGRWGAGIGAATGGMLSLLGGPAGLLVWAAAGAVIGGVAGRHVGRTIPESDLKALGEHLPPNSSALLVLSEDKDAESVIDDMKGYSATVITLTVGDQASGEIATVVAGEVTGPDASKGDAAPTASQSKADTKG